MKTLVAALILIAPVAFAGKIPVVPESSRSIGKQVAPVELAQLRRYEVTIAERVLIDVDLRLLRDADALSVEIIADPGLALEQRVLRHDLGAHAAGLVRLPPVEVTVLDQGRHYLNVIVSMRGEWGERFRSFSVPLETPTTKDLPARRDLKTDSSGQALRVMPAVQTDQP